MALTAAGALAYHLWVSNGDRRATLVAGRAAGIRHLVFYGLALIGLFNIIGTYTTGWLGSRTICVPTASACSAVVIPSSAPSIRSKNRQ